MEYLTQVFAMNGYGLFVWPAFGITAIILIGLLSSSRRNWHRQVQLAADLEARLPYRPRRNKIV